MLGEPLFLAFSPHHGMVAPMAKAPALKKKPAQKRISPAERERVEVLFKRFESLELHPKTELNYSNPYELVTAVALSAQATDVQVNKATGPLFQGLSQEFPGGYRLIHGGVDHIQEQAVGRFFLAVPAEKAASLASHAERLGAQVEVLGHVADHA